MGDRSLGLLGDTPVEWPESPPVGMDQETQLQSPALETPNKWQGQGILGQNLWPQG